MGWHPTAIHTRDPKPAGSSAERPPIDPGENKRTQDENAVPQENQKEECPT